MTTTEPEVHFELVLPRRELPVPGSVSWLSFTEPLLVLPLVCWRLSGCDGGKSTMTRELELHLDWSLSSAISRASTFS
jgi:hypothetical protein